MRALLMDPQRIQAEYERRLENESAADPRPGDVLEKRMAALQRGIKRLIDSYQDGLLEKEEFEPRIRGLRDRLSQLQAAINEVVSRESEANDLRLIIGQLEGFAERVREGLDSGGFALRREIIRTLIKRVELDEETVRIVYKVNVFPPVD
ncbi:MAG TPA: recombinase family protein, partial [Isosphaeraceae bacterium]|nr:recombinase family protein [Isosphaeraceae bacterium]